MKKNFLIIFVIFIIFLPLAAEARSLANRLSGRILLNVEQNGEAWYVFPYDHKRYYLGRPQDAFKIMRELGVGISNFNIQRLAKANMPVSGDVELAERLSGQILLQVEQNGEAWYVYPVDKKIYYLGRPQDAFKIMRELGLGISREDLAKIHKPGLTERLDQYSVYEHKKIKTKKGVFSVDIVSIDLDNPNLLIKTIAAAPHPTPNKKSGYFGANTLAQFVLNNNAFAGINGTYFDVGSARPNYYFFPLYDSVNKKLINEDQLKYWTTGPIMAFDNKNNFYYFKDSREFKSVDEFNSRYNAKLQALIGNKPRLIEKKMNLLIEWDIDKKQRNIKTVRNALAYKEDNNGGKGEILLVVATNATVPDLADIMQAMDVDYALNLDGGSSSGLWYNDEYMVIPGRKIPNVIVFSQSND